MTLWERITNTLGFAEKRPSDMGVEIGSGSTGLSKTFGDEEKNTDTLTVEDYIKMQQNDGQVTAIVKAITLPIKAAEYTIVEADGWDKETESPELQFIKQNLLAPVQKGGMEIPIGHIIADMLRAITEGFRTYEKVYDVYDGKVRLKKLAIRPNNTVTLMTNENGDYIGYRQQVQYGGRYIDVKIPAEKTLLVTFQKDKNWLYGESILKPVYYHYDKKHKLYFIHYVVAEMAAVKPRSVKEKVSDGNYISAVNKVVDQLGFKSRMTYDPNKVEIEFHDVANPAVMDGIMRMIEEQNTQMSKAIMAGFIESSTGAYGSKAMVSESQEFFKMGVSGIMKFIEEHINSYIIPELIDYNFASGLYPQFKFSPIDNKSVQFVYDALLKMIEKGNVPDEVKKALLAQGVDLIGLDVDMETVQFTQPEVKQVVASEQVSHSHVDLAEEEVMPRELYPDEAKVSWVEYQKAYNAAETQAVAILDRQIKKQKDSIVSKYVAAVKSGNPVKVSQVQIQLADSPTYSDELEKLYEQYFAFGKLQAANEANVPAKKVNADDKKFIKSTVATILAKQVADLSMRLATVANESIADQNNGLIDATERISGEYDAYWEKVLPTTANLMASRSINGGNMSVFLPLANENVVKAFRYSAVLDKQTTNYCRSLNGKTFAADDPNFNRLTPPNHYGCRSKWVAIFEDVAISGKPAGFKVQESIDTFKDLSEVETLLDSNLKLLGEKTAELENKLIEKIDATL